MKKLIDTPKNLLINSLRGFAKSHADIIELSEQPQFIYRKENYKHKVAIISGGGAGHEPLHTGFVGSGMLDAACPGQIFTSPTPDQILAAAKQVGTDAGVLFIVKNYAGDVMSFEMAAEMLDIPNALVLVVDDIALPKSHSIGRRGVAGTLIVEKMVGAAAENGADLNACLNIAQRVNQVTASLGVALSSCTVPAVGHPTFTLADDEIEIGVGIHGERGTETTKWLPAHELAESMTLKIIAELQPKPGQTVLLHINGFGATPLIELYLIYELVWQLLTQQELIVERSLVGNYTTSLDMAGCSISVCLLDEELLSLWDAPVHTAALRWAC